MRLSSNTSRVVVIGLLLGSSTLASSACGGRIEPVGDGSGSSSGTAAPSPTGLPTSGPFPGPEPSEPPPSTPPKRPPPSTSNGDYAAFAMPGGLDHLFIYKASFGDDTCVMIHLTHPRGITTGPFSSIDVPGEWGVAGADRSIGATSCRPGVSRATTQADDGKGVVSWTTTPGQLYPCSLDLRVSLIFPATPSDPPTVEQLDAKAVAVAGCN